MNWREKFRKLFVEPLNSDIRATNLNNEPCVMATAKEMEAFISNLLKEALTEAMGKNCLECDSTTKLGCYKDGYNDHREHVKKVLDKYN